MATISPVNLPKRSAFWQKNLNRGYKSESGLQGFRMAIKKKREKYGKVLIHRKFLPNFIKGRKTEGRRVLRCRIKSFEREKFSRARISWQTVSLACHGHNFGKFLPRNCMNGLHIKLFKYPET
jgi:hypothetical protein